jgi:hypothetical protein
MGVTKRSGDNETIYVKVQSLLPMLDGKFVFPDTKIVDLEPVFDFMDVNNKIQVFVDQEKTIYRGDITMDGVQQREVNELISLLRREYQFCQEENYRVRELRTYIGETITPDVV